MARDHPENNLSDFCDQDQIKQYQTIVGHLIWFSRVGRFDITVHIMTMSGSDKNLELDILKESRRSLVTLPTFLMDL